MSKAGGNSGLLFAKLHKTTIPLSSFHLRELGNAGLTKDGNQLFLQRFMISANAGFQRAPRLKRDSVGMTVERPE